MIKTIIFDCWGTLFTTSQSPHPFERFAQKIGHTITDRGFVKLFEHHLMLTAHDDLKKPIRCLLQDLKVAYDERLVEELKGILVGSIATQDVYPETMQNLLLLKGRYDLILLTNSFKQGYEGLCEKFAIESLFKGVVTSYESHHMKPDLEPFRAAMAMAECAPSEIVVVGDNILDDIEPAQGLGMSAILVDRKARYPEFYERITTLADLQEALDHIDQSRI